MANRKQKVILKFKNDDFVTQLTDLLLKAGQVKVGGLGIFEIKKINARQGYNVSNGSRITIPEHNKVAFRPTTSFKELVQTYGKND